jgi:hypothetical protein
MIERRPRAPVLRTNGAARHSRQRIRREGQLHVLHVEETLVLLQQGVLRLGEDLDQSLSSRSSRVAMTGRRPMNSGIRPKR